MNRRLRLLVIILLAAVLFLSAAIVSFRLSGSQPVTENTGAAPSAGHSAVILFEGSNGMKGARTANGRVLIEPTWYYLRTMSDSVLIARRGSDKTEHYGLIATNGELLVPFLYRSFYPADSAGGDLWLASFEEDGKLYYHLYHADGTRWTDAAWDECEYEDGVLSIGSGANKWKAVPENGQLRPVQWHTEMPVGLHQLVTDLDEAHLRRLPPADVIMQLSETAANYLTYLFVTKTPPDASLISAESTASVRVEYRYNSCRLISADISRIGTGTTEGLPSYILQMQVRYQRPAEDGTLSLVDTAMILRITQNSAGAYTYSEFSDLQYNAAGGV